MTKATNLAGYSMAFHSLQSPFKFGGVDTNKPTVFCTGPVGVVVAVGDEVAMVETAVAEVIFVAVLVAGRGVPVTVATAAGEVDVAEATWPGWLVAVCTAGGVAVGGIARVELNNAVIVWLGVGKTKGVGVL